MSDHSWSKIKGLGVAVAVIGVAGLGFLVGRSAPVDVLARSYGTSLEQISSDWTGSAPVSGENLWLSRTDETYKGVRQALAVGDRINIGGTSGRADSYEVTAVELIEADVLGNSDKLIQIVTGRADGSPHAASIRFIFAVEAPALSPAPAKPEKVL